MSASRFTVFFKSTLINPTSPMDPFRSKHSLAKDTRIWPRLKVTNTQFDDPGSDPIAPRGSVWGAFQSDAWATSIGFLGKGLSTVWYFSLWLLTLHFQVQVPLQYNSAHQEDTPSSCSKCYDVPRPTTGDASQLINPWLQTPVYITDWWNIKRLGVNLILTYALSFLGPRGLTCIN